MNDYDYDYFSGKDIALPPRTKRPVMPKPSAPATEYAEYASKLSVYEAEFAQRTESLDAYDAAIAARKYEFKAKLAADYGLTIAEADVLYGKAWDDGHSEGLYAVHMKFDEYFYLVTAFVKVSKK